MALYGSGDTVTFPDRFELVKDLKKMQTICWNLHEVGTTNGESTSRVHHLVWDVTIQTYCPILEKKKCNLLGYWKNLVIPFIFLRKKA